MDNDGLSTGYWVQCYLFSTPLLFTILLKHSLMTRHWVWITHFVIALSILLNLIIMFADQLLLPYIIYSDSWTSVITHLAPSYYVLIILMPIVCLLPDFIST